MKKAALIITLLFCGSLLSAQNQASFRINGYTNYVFDDRVDSYYSSTAYFNGTVKGGFQWGLGVEFMLTPNQGFEIVYHRQDTKAPTEYFDDAALFDPVKTTTFDLDINYIFIGTTRYYQISEIFEPYFGGQAGVGIIEIMNPLKGGSNSTTKFSWGFKLGTHIWLTPMFGLKVQGALQSIAQAVGGGFYFGTGGAGVGATSLSTLYQFSVGGGLVFKFGGQGAKKKETKVKD